MFENLPIVSKSSVLVVADKELPEFASFVERSQSPTDALNLLCSELSEHNVWLAKAMKSIGVSIHSAYHKDYPEIPDTLWELIKAWSGLGVIAALIFGR